MIVFDWQSGTETQTPGELLEYFIDGDKIVVSSNLAKNEFHLNFQQAQDMMCGLAGLLNELRKRDAGK